MRHVPAHFALLLCLLSASCAVPGKTLPSLMVERLSWMDDVAQVKHAKSLPVTDAKREAELLHAMEKKGAVRGLPAPAVHALFAGQIDAAKQLQTEWLHAHKHVPVAQGGLPDLAATVRPALDDIGNEMLSALVIARTKGNAPQILAAARAQMTAAGYSPAVITPALKGLETALTAESAPPAGQ